jgi:hypothetical protein
LRELQRRHKLAVVLVHHARKSAANMRAGQALRGSSEFHAWGDSNLYLRREGNELTLTVEHRAASAMPRVTLELAQRGNSLALEVVDRKTISAQAIKPDSIEDRIVDALTKSARPQSFTELRTLCRVRTTTLYQHLAAMTAAGRIVKSADRYHLTVS